MKNQTTFILSILSGIILIAGEYCAFFLLYDDVTNPENYAYSIPSILIIFGLALNLIIFGIYSVKKQINLEEYSLKQHIFIFQIIFMIYVFITSILTNFFLILLRLFKKHIQTKDIFNSRTKPKWIASFFLLIIIIIPSILSIYISDAFKPRTLYPRLENVEYDPLYTYNSNYGDVFTTLTTIYPWNLPMYEPDDYAWAESYHLKTLVHYYNITQDPDLFFNIVNRCEIIVSNSDRNNDGIPGFGTSYYTEPDYVEYIVWDGMICQPIAQTARLIKNNASLFSIYNENYTRFLDICEKIVQKLNFTKWHEFDGKYGRYGYYVDGPGDSKIYNRINIIGNLFYELYMITGNQTYRTMIEKIGNFMKMGLEPNKYKINHIEQTMYVWSYSEYIPTLKWGDKSSVSDTSHASIDVEFIVNCYRLGLCFNLNDMKALSNTFFDFIFRGFNEEKYYSDQVDGFVGTSNYYLNILDGYAKLYQFYRDPDLGLYIVKRVNQKMVDDGWIYAVGTTRILSYLLELERNNVWF